MPHPPAGPVPGTFRDRAPVVERALLHVIDGTVTVVPASVDAYPAGFVLAETTTLQRWRGQLSPPPPVRNRFPAITRWLFPVMIAAHGGGGDWVLLGQPVTGAFQPDDPAALARVAQEQGIEIGDAAPDQHMPEPDGGVAAFAYFTTSLPGISAIFSFVDLVRSLEPGSNTSSLALRSLLSFVASACLVVLVGWLWKQLLPRISRHRRMQGDAYGTTVGVSLKRSVTIGAGCGALAGLVLALLPNSRPSTLFFAPLAAALIGGAIGVIFALSGDTLRAEVETRRRSWASMAEPHDRDV